MRAIRVLAILLVASGITARGEMPAKIGRPVRVVSIGFSGGPIESRPRCGGSDHSAGDMDRT